MTEYEKSEEIYQAAVKSLGEENGLQKFVRQVVKNLDRLDESHLSRALKLIDRTLS